MFSYNTISALPALVEYSLVVIINTSNNHYLNFTFNCFDALSYFGLN